MIRCLGLLTAAAVLLLAASGCGGTGRQQWEMTAENKGDVPCSISVTLDGGGAASVSDLTRGRPHVLIGGGGRTVVRTVKVRTVKVTRGKDERVLTPDAELPAGKRYAVVVGLGGQVEAAVSDR